jgi:hypothetical protein
LNGPTLSRNQLLAANGWRVLSVPTCDWDALKTDEERKAFLREKLDGSMHSAGKIL